MKFCPRCKLVRPITDFRGSRSSKDGLAGYCRPCSKAYAAWYHKNVRVQKEGDGLDRLHEWAKNHKEKVNEKSRKGQFRRMLTRYGLTEEGYDALLRDQEGKCGLCRQEARHEERLTRLVFDHDHQTGQLRGLICGRCNRGLGLLGDDLVSLKRAVEYLGG